MIEDARPGVQSKASTKFIEKIAKLPDGSGLEKELSPVSSVHKGFYIVFWLFWGGAELASPWIWLSDS
jgi:hypothetical protein